MEIYALNKDLNTLGAIQAKSLIWIPRYNRVGSCEVRSEEHTSELQSRI